ncbi:hypothetical protein E2562_000155 [Oryza meyeriana var. granulata]|uniref:Hydrophobic seed protein domain-containing protein n=1 Tax=Oryza meyeriana var. granulata TaxID=110450 RepID=A0A6G1DBP3_9ORYZ|nr:hypothetical protein E2562_000155 [Oryza meyeriana var. granulata]
MPGHFGPCRSLPDDQRPPPSSEPAVLHGDPATSLSALPQISSGCHLPASPSPGCCVEARRLDSSLNTPQQIGCGCCLDLIATPAQPARQSISPRAEIRP